MTVNVTGYFKQAERRIGPGAGLGLALALLGTAPLAAQDQPQDEPIRNQSPDARDVAMTPLRDLNLSKDPIPELLLAAEAAPYDATGLKKCRDIGAAIAELDAVLGPDLDVMAEDDDRLSMGRIARSAVGSLIPFRSIVREVTGAADHQRDFERAIHAAAVRRGFLKGLGQQRGCAYPARPAFARVKVNKTDQVDTEEGRKRAARKEERAAVGAGISEVDVVKGNRLG